MPSPAQAPAQLPKAEAAPTPSPSSPLLGEDGGRGREGEAREEGVMGVRGGGRVFEKPQVRKLQLTRCDQGWGQGGR